MVGVPAPENAADDYPKAVGVDILNNGRGFNHTTSNKIGLPPGQLGGAECVGEDEVVQAGDTAESIQRDCADSNGGFSPKRVL